MKGLVKSSNIELVVADALQEGTPLVVGEVEYSTGGVFGVLDLDSIGLPFDGDDEDVFSLREELLIFKEVRPGGCLPPWSSRRAARPRR